MAMKRRGWSYSVDGDHFLVEGRRVRLSAYADDPIGTMANLDEILRRPRPGQGLPSNYGSLPHELFTLGGDYIADRSG